VAGMVLVMRRQNVEVMGDVIKVREVGLATEVQVMDLATYAWKRCPPMGLATSACTRCAPLCRANLAEQMAWQMGFDRLIVETELSSLHVPVTSATKPIRLITAFA